MSVSVQKMNDYEHTFIKKAVLNCDYQIIIIDGIILVK